MVKRKVEITVKGVQTADGQSDSQTIVCKGIYHKKNGKNYILYEEELEDGIKKTVLKLGEKNEKPFVDVIMSGTVEAHLSFEQDGRRISTYSTPYGIFPLEIATKDIYVFVDEEEIKASVRYTISLEGSILSENKMEISVAWDMED